MAKITPSEAVISGNLKPQFLAPDLAQVPRFFDEQNVYIYERLPEQSGPGAGQEPLQGVITLLDLDSLRPGKPRRFQATDMEQCDRHLTELRNTGLQSEPVPVVADFLLQDWQGRAVPVLQCVRDKVVERLWRLQVDDSAVAISTQALEGLSLAGGEALWDAIHRYYSESPGRRLSGRKKPVMVLAIPRQALALGAVHRVVYGVPAFQAGEMVCRARENFFFEDVTQSMPRLNGTGPHFDAEMACRLLAPRARGELAMLAITGRSSFRVHSGPGWADGVLAHLSPILRESATARLHEIVFERHLGIKRELTSAHVKYEADMQAAVQAVAAGANVAFLMNAPDPQLLERVAELGEALPAHSAQCGGGLRGLLAYAVAE